MGVIIAPLLSGTQAGSSLRTDWRKIEDKMIQHHIELRPFHLNISVGSLHGNAEQPSCYTAWIAVLDHVLPTKGVQYRMCRTNHKDSDSPSRVLKDNVNMLLAFLQILKVQYKHSLIFFVNKRPKLSMKDVNDVI